MGGFLTPAELEALQARRDDPAVGRLLAHVEAAEVQRLELIESADALVDEQDARIRSLEQTLQAIKQETRLSSDQATLGVAINRLLRIWDLVESVLVSNEQEA